MYKKIYTIHFSYLLCCGILLIISIINNCVFAQSINSDGDSLRISLNSDTIFPQLTYTISDTLSTDSLSTDSLPSGKKISKNGLEHTVTYDAKDSIHFSIKNKVAYLFNEAYVLYEDMSLYAYYIEIDFANNELYASGALDENGNVIGSPVLKQGDGVFRAQEIKYNFETKKGKITHVITEEGEGYIHGEQIKKLEDNTTYIKKGKYTTCELDHPHFEISFTKAKVLPNDKIIMGPAYVSFVDIPTPLAIPFGYFPLEKGRHSGLVMPTFGETQSLGFYLQNIGYYFGISDNFDLLLAGDIYTRGRWHPTRR